MGEKRTLLERSLPYVRPTVVTGFAPAPVQLGPGLWVLDRRLRMPGGPVLPLRTTIVASAAGDLAVVSPPPSAPGGLEAIDALGKVRDVVVPNSFHYLYAGDFLVRFPDARLWTAPGRTLRAPALASGTELGEVAPAQWPGELEHAVLGPTRGVAEVALFHRESATLVLTDLAFHMARFERVFDRIAWRLSGVPAGFGPSRTARTTLLQDRPLVAAFLAKVLAWPFRRILVAHGEALEDDAQAAFRRAFADWIPAAS